MYKINEAVTFKLYIVDSAGSAVTGCTVTSTLYDEADAQHSTPAVTEIGATGLYTGSVTPDAAGEWTLVFHCATPRVERAVTIHVGKGVEASIETKVDTVDGVVDTILVDTNELQTDWKNGGRLDNLLDAVALASICTEVRLAHLNADISSRSSHSAANVRAETCLTGDGADSIGKILFDLNAWWKDTGRLDNLLDAIPTTAMRGTDSAATETKQDAQDVLLARIELSAVMWGGIEDELTLKSAADPAVPDAATKFTPDIPAGVTITRAFLLMKFREITCAAAANYVSTAGVVQVKKAAGAFLSGITIPTGILDVASGVVAPGDVWIGKIDVKAQVTDGTECEFKLLTLRSNADDLLIRDVQFGLQIYYTL